MKPITVTIPYPPLGLSPNSLARNRFVLANLKAQAKRDAWGCAFEVMPPIKPDPNALYEITMRARRRGRQDKDNLIARMKHSLDGVAQAIGVDDGRFDSYAVVWDKEHDANSVTVVVAEKRAA